MTSAVDPDPTPAPGTLPALGNTPGAPLNPAAERADEFADYPRDQWDRPLIARLDADGNPTPNPLTGQTDRYGTLIRWVSDPFTRASTLGSALEHEGGINSWRIRQAVIGFMARPDLFALAQTVTDPGGEGRSELDDRIKEADAAAGSGSAANRGTAMHAFAEKLDKGVTLPALGEEPTAWLKAYRELTAGWVWEDVEARLVCRVLSSAGRTDRLGRPPAWMIAPDGTIIGPEDLVAVDLKTSSSSKYFGVKFAVQLAVYAHGERYDPVTGRSAPTGARRDWAMVLHIPSGASSGSWWWVNVAAGLELGHLAQEVLAGRKRKDLVAMAATQTYATLEDALAAGGVRHEPAADPEPVMDAQPAPEQTERTTTTSTVPDSVTAGIRSDLGPHLQRQAQLARELEALRTAPPRGALGAIRERYAASWSDDHQAAYDLREWELGIITALETSTTTDNIQAVAQMVSGWGRWTEEFRKVARHRADQLMKGGQE